jgi:FkbM family methyltransferase
MTNYLASKYSNEIERKYIEVEADTLDNLLGQLAIDEANCIKVHAEGAELEVLKGAAGILSKSSDLALFVEVHSDDLVGPYWNYAVSTDSKYNLKR